MHLGTAKVESKVSVQASVLGRSSAVVCKTRQRLKGVEGHLATVSQGEPGA